MSQQRTSTLKYPFDIVEAKQRQDETATRTGLPVELSIELSDDVKMDFMLIPAGDFMMGSTENEEGRASDEDIHRVSITKHFYMSKHLCTQEQWQIITGNNPSYFTDKLLNPVEDVSWIDIEETLPTIQNYAPESMKVRLPTEAEWEYACRAGTSTPFNFGAVINTSQANFNGKYPYSNTPEGKYRKKTTRVHTFPANGWGLHDMHGNVWEWCADWYDEDFYLQCSCVDPVNSRGARSRVLRGGSWIGSAGDCRSAYRCSLYPDYKSYDVGVRLCVNLL